MTSTVLVIDDSVAIRAVLEVLVKLDQRLTWLPPAADGVAGLAAARAQPPDIVICDVHMPGMSGHTVARRLRRMCPHVVIGMFTADERVTKRGMPHVDATFDKADADVAAMLDTLVALCETRGADRRSYA